jgi:hypothetical protein
MEDFHILSYLLRLYADAVPHARTSTVQRGHFIYFSNFSKTKIKFGSVVVQAEVPNFN